MGPRRRSSGRDRSRGAGVVGNHAVSSGHFLASQAGFRILEQGGNATDAGVAAGIALNVVLPASTSFGGVAPILIYDTSLKRVVSISGLGRWPRSASTEYFTQDRSSAMAPGVKRVVVPAAADAWMTALIEHGTMSFEDVVTPALELARDGFRVTTSLARPLSEVAVQLGEWPSTAAIYLRGGMPLQKGDLLVQADLARTFERLVEVERGHTALSREEAIFAARQYFYLGQIAEEIVSFVVDNGGLLSMEDMAAFSVGHEPPCKGEFREYHVFTNGPWSQGPMLAQTLQMLAKDDLGALGHNSTEYVHLIAECLKLAFADRDAFFGDPDFVNVPISGLLTSEYANVRRREVSMAAASPAMPAAGDPWTHENRGMPVGYGYVPPKPTRGTSEPDTSYVCAVDSWGNMFSATPSDTLGMAPVIPGLGFAPSGRGTQSWLDPGHPSVLAPGKRPRLTPNAVLAFKDGMPWMPFGTPGGDAQCQSTLQFFLNIAVFGLTPQRAVEAPRFLTWSFPNSFWPHRYEPGRLDLEGRISHKIGEELGALGHDVKWVGEYDITVGDVCGILLDPGTRTVQATSDVRGDACAIAR